MSGSTNTGWYRADESYEPDYESYGADESYEPDYMGMSVGMSRAVAGMEPARVYRVAISIAKVTTAVITTKPNWY